MASFTQMVDRLRTRVIRNSQLGRIIANTGWLSIDRVLRLVVSFFVGVGVARYLGPEQFGRLNYAMALVGLFAAFGSLGLNQIIVRDFVEQPDKRHVIFGTSFVLLFCSNLMVLAASLAAVTLSAPGNYVLLILVLLIAFGQIFHAFDVIDFWFQSQIQSKYTVLAKTASLLLIPAFKIVLVLLAAPLWTFALANMMELLLGGIGLFLIYKMTEGQWRKWRFDLPFSKVILGSSWPLMLAGVAITIYMKSDQIILGQLAGDEALGVYSVAVRISSIWYFVPMTIMASLFPVLLAAKKRSLDEYYRRLEQAYWFLGILSFGVALVITFTANWIIQILFGPAYAEAGPVLAVHIWAGIPVAIGVATSPWLIAEGKTQIALQKTVFGAVTNVLLNFLLIPIYGAMGAAIATVIAYTVATLIWHIVDRRMVPIGKIQFAALFPRLYIKSIRLIVGRE